MKVAREAQRKCLTFGKTISSLAHPSTQLTFYVELHVLSHLIGSKEGNHMPAHLHTSLDRRTTQGLVTAECRVYYPSYSKTYKQLLPLRYLKSVRISLDSSYDLVYSVVKLRLPDDLLMNALTDQVEAKIFQMNPKETALVSWALARSKLPPDAPLTKKLIAGIYVHVNQI